MRHAVRSDRLERPTGARRALLRSLVSALLVHERIETTVNKAKALCRVADHLVTLGRTPTLPNRRAAYDLLQRHDLVAQLFRDIAPRFQARRGGYTRLIRTRRRPGDGAELALVELTERRVEAVPKKAAGRRKTAEAAAATRAAGTGGPGTGPGGPQPRREEPRKPRGFLRGLRQYLKGQKRPESGG